MNLCKWAAFAVPRRAREAVLADLLEEASLVPAAHRQRWLLRELLAIGWSYQSGDLRQLSTLRALALATAGAALLAASVPQAAQTVIDGASAVDTPWHAWTVSLWRASDALAGLATGLGVGLLPQPATALTDGWRAISLVAAMLVVAAMKGAGSAAAHGALALLTLALALSARRPAPGVGDA